MGRLMRSRLKAGVSIRRDSYLLVVSCTSLLLYAICLYTFLHVNGYVGAKSLVSPPLAAGPAAAPGAAGSPNHYANGARPAVYHKSQAQFDDGKIHEFEHNVGQPVDWEMRVRGTVYFSFTFVFNEDPCLLTVLLT